MAKKVTFKPVQFLPSFGELDVKTCEFVRDYQGKKGYIDTQNRSCDILWGFIMDYDIDCYKETHIKAVRYNKTYGRIEVVCDELNIKYSSKDFKDADWEPISGGDIQYIATLYNIAEVIHEYVEK
jgi:hypothetical protein